MEGTVPEQEKRNLYTIAIAIAVAGLLLSCLAGAFAGGLIGFMVAGRRADAIAERARQFQNPLPDAERVPERIPVPDDLPVPMPLLEGSLVREVTPGSAAEDAGLQPGDIIVAVDDVPIDANHPLPDVIAQYRPGERVAISFLRDGNEQSVRVTLDEHPDVAGRAYLGVRVQTMMRRQQFFELPSQ